MVDQTHGITTETVHRFVLDAGACYLNYGEEDEVLLGATRGGNIFLVEQDVKIMDVDGARGPLKGARRIITIRPRITANLIEIDTAALLAMLPGSAEADYPSTEAKTHDAITRIRDIIDGDYLTNVAIVGKVSGADEDLICIIKEALSDENMQLSMVDKDEGVIAVTFTGHFTTADLATEPWEIRYPVISEES